VSSIGDLAFGLWAHNICGSQNLTPTTNDQGQRLNLVPLTVRVVTLVLGAALTNLQLNWQTHDKLKQIGHGILLSLSRWEVKI